MDPHINPATGVWDDNYYANIGRFQTAGGGVPMPDFNFDYAAEAQKAYGDLGAYYDRILKESEGDMNKVLARLATDYETGVRRRKEDLTTTQGQMTEDQLLALQNAGRAVQENALARGIYQKSAYAPSGYGVADTTLKEVTDPINTGYARQGKTLLTSFTRAQEDAGTGYERQKTDIPEQQKRYAYDLEQQRRREASDLANTRGSRAFSDWSRKNAFNPTLT